MLLYLRDGSTQTICTCCHAEIEVPTFYLTQSQYTDTGPTSPSADPITPGAWQGSQWSAIFEVTGMTRPEKIQSQLRFKLRTFRFRGGRLNHLANEVVRLTGQGVHLESGRSGSDSRFRRGSLPGSVLPVAYQLALQCRISAGTGRPGVRIPSLGEK